MAGHEGAVRLCMQLCNASGLGTEGVPGWRDKPVTVVPGPGQEEAPCLEQSQGPSPSSAVPPAEPLVGTHPHCPQARPGLSTLWGLCWTQGLPACLPALPHAQVMVGQHVPLLCGFCTELGLKELFLPAMRSQQILSCKARIFSALESHYLTLPRRRSLPKK